MVNNRELPKVIIKGVSDIERGKIPTVLNITLIVIGVIFLLYAGLITSMANISESYFRDEFIYATNSPRHEYAIVPKGKFNKAMVKYGEKYARENSDLLVVSLVRNCAGSIPCMEKKVQVLASVFRNVHVVLFENNSTDSTREDLLEYALGGKRMGGDNVRVTLVNPFTMAINEKFCSSPSEDFKNNHKAGIKGASGGRIGRMTYLRNKVLDYVYAHQSEYDTLLMTDMDIIGRIFPTGIKETMGYLKTNKNKIGFVTFRGFFPSGGFFDPFSYRGTDFLSKSRLGTLLTCMKSYYLMPSGKGLQPVVSSHSGGIFANLPLPPSLRYSCDHVITIPFVTDIYLCEHITLMEKVPNNFVNTNMTFLVKDNV